MPDEPKAGSCPGMGLRTLSVFPRARLGSKQESLDKEWRVASDGEGVKVFRQVEEHSLQKH